MPIDMESPDMKALYPRLEKGDVVLFCGAGFSVDSKNTRGKAPPLGAALAKILAELASLDYAGEPLPLVYKAAIKRVGTRIINDTLRELYFIVSQAVWYDAVSTFIWNRIYTTNIDNLLERIYLSNASQRLDRIICPASNQDRDPHFSTLQCIHLHGCVDDFDKGLTFTLDEFAQQQAVQNPWYEELADDVFFRPIIFVGSLMEESPFHHYLAMRDIKCRTVSEFRPKSYLISPYISQIRAEALKEQNIVAVEATAADFFAGLRERYSAAPLTIQSVRRTMFPHIFATSAPTQESIVRHFDPIFSDNLPASPRTLAHSFYLGAEPTWKDIEERRDGERAVTHAIVEGLERHDNRFQCFLIHGPAGCGKTTIMKRLAYELAAKGKTVYFAKGDHLLDFKGIVELANDPAFHADRIFVLIDTMSRQLTAVHRARDELRGADRLSLILADRTNAFALREHALADLDPRSMSVPDLTREDVDSILARLEQFGFLGALRDKTHEERVEAFMVRASRQLLVAMKEATSGKGFDEILEDEFKQLVPQAQLAYTICCLAVTQGAPGVYRRNLLPCLGKADFLKGSIISELLRGVLISANEMGTLLQPRHRVIAYEVATRIAPLGIKYEAILTFLKQISSEINRTSVKSRAPAFRAYRGLINSDGLYTLLEGHRDTIISLYEEVRDYYREQFLFWLHFGMAYKDQGDLDVAENYLGQALAICREQHGNPFQIRHQLGILYLMQACRTQPAIAARERATDGISILKEMIQERGDVDSYPYNGYMEHVTRWYIHAREFITDTEWDDLKKLAQIAAKKYPMNDLVREARDKVERAYLLRLVKDADLGQLKSS